MAESSLPPGYRYAKARELNDSFQISSLEAFALEAKKNDGYFDIPDIPGSFQDGFLWKRGHSNHGILRIRLRTLEKVLAAKQQMKEVLNKAPTVAAQEKDKTSLKNIHSGASRPTPARPRASGLWVRMPSGKFPSRESGFEQGIMRGGIVRRTSYYDNNI